MPSQITNLQIAIILLKYYLAYSIDLLWKWICYLTYLNILSYMDINIADMSINKRIYYIDIIFADIFLCFRHLFQPGTVIFDLRYHYFLIVFLWKSFTFSLSFVVKNWRVVALHVVFSNVMCHSNRNEVRIGKVIEA